MMLISTLFNSKDNTETSKLWYILTKVYVRINENGHPISIKIVSEKIKAFKIRGTSYPRRVTNNVLLDKTKHD